MKTPCFRERSLEKKSTSNLEFAKCCCLGRAFQGCSSWLLVQRQMAQKFQPASMFCSSRAHCKPQELRTQTPSHGAWTQCHPDISNVDRTLAKGVPDLRNHIGRQGLGDHPERIVASLKAGALLITFGLCAHDSPMSVGRAWAWGSQNYRYHDSCEAVSFARMLSCEPWCAADVPTAAPQKEGFAPC